MSAELYDFQEKIAKIPTREKKAFVLHDVLGYKYKEIAEIMDIKVNSVGVYIHRARTVFFEESDESSRCRSRWRVVTSQRLRAA
ncbi:sigma factor-like helix-turn-helix DNA-binding protein [Candidatus Uabimicrobium sp. HlEnr_7]|uniref:sigma-70 region 4 domain-containing protein n=1 Tax=Candidatus Uabimicrobium helgolandensis TaxID=3095367 RepID=UPI0035564B35